MTIKNLQAYAGRVPYLLWAPGATVRAFTCIPAWMRRQPAHSGSSHDAVLIVKVTNQCKNNSVSMFVCSSANMPLW